MHRTSAWPLALIYTALIVFASLFPFDGWRAQGIDPLVFLLAPLPPPYWTGFDITVNVAGYAPLGFLLVLAVLRSGGGRGVVLLATLAGAIKPHFVLVGLLVEGYAWRRSGRLPLAVPVAAGLLLAYLLAAWYWAPHYLAMVRLLARGYMAHEADWFSFLSAPYFQATAVLSLLALLAMPQRDNLARVLLLAIAGFALAALIQHKPWPYHWIPALALACLLFGQALAQAAASQAEAGLARGPLVALLALALLSGLALRMASGERYNPNPGILGPAIRAHGGGPVIIFSRFAVSFPLVTEAGIGSSTRFPTMTIVQAMERSGDSAAVAWIRAAFASDFYRQPPRLLVLETDARGQPLFDFIAYFAPQVPQLRDYRPVGQVGNFQLLQAPDAP